MIKIKLLIVFLLIFFKCQAQKKDTLKEYYDNGQIKFKVPLIDNKKNGIGKTYFNNGDLKITAEYKNNMLNGKLTQQYHDRIIKEVHYKNDSLNGYARYYYPNKNLKEEGIYISNKKNGKWKEYNEDGGLFYENIYMDDKKNGSYIRYYPSGEIEMTGNWKNGRIHGENRTYNKDHKLIKWQYLIWTKDWLISFEGPTLEQVQDPSFKIKEINGKVFYWINNKKIEAKPDKKIDEF